MLWREERLKITTLPRYKLYRPNRIEMRIFLKANLSLFDNGLHKRAPVQVLMGPGVVALWVKPSVQHGYLLI